MSAGVAAAAWLLAALVFVAGAAWGRSVGVPAGLAAAAGALRALAKRREEAGEWRVAGALREGAHLVEHLDDSGPAGPGTEAEV